jgi:O-antigen/teichoic acid export membrane protein
VFGRVRSGASVLPEMAYSLRMTLSGLLSYSAGNIGKLALGNGFGAATLGHWNRGEVVTSVPFYQAQNAVAQALYPQFRHDIDSMERSRRVWPDLLGLVAWLSVPLASVAAVVLPALIPLLFGPGWTAVAGLVPLMALIGGLQIVAFVLVGALEILARFRWIWAGHLCTLGVNALGGLMALVLHSVVPVLIGGLSSLVVMHGLHLWLCGRAGLFPVGRLLRHYAGVAAFSAGAAAAAYVVVHAPSVRTDPGAAALLGTALVGCAVALWRFREHLPVVRLARKYALIPV